MTKQTRRRTIILFGGGGYIGHYVAHEIVRRNHLPINYDWQRRCEVEGAPLNFKDTLPIMCDGFIHLACPRNKPGRWNRKLAQLAWEDGCKVASKCPGPKIYVSSMSVFDEPRTDYGEFKLMTEQKARQEGFKIVRLGTVYGVAPGMPYREDLALHTIMRSWLYEPRNAFVHDRARRHVVYIHTVARQLAILVLADDPTRIADVTELTEGIVSYKDIVPISVRQQRVGDPGPRPSVGRSMCTADKIQAQECLMDFAYVLTRKEKPAWPI